MTTTNPTTTAQATVQVPRDLQAATKELGDIYRRRFRYPVPRRRLRRRWGAATWAQEYGRLQGMFLEREHSYLARLSEIDALTEQVRVLRELLHNAMAYIPNEYDDELALRNSIADALAALEGGGEK